MYHGDTRDHSASGEVDNRTGYEPIYIERVSLIYPSFNAFGLMSLYINVGNINFLGEMSVYVKVCLALIFRTDVKIILMSSQK